MEIFTLYWIPRPVPEAILVVALVVGDKGEELRCHGSQLLLSRACNIGITNKSKRSV
jgi:hypothetical protein